jgi:predicted RecB family endonuclease
MQPLIAASQTLRGDELLRRLPDGVKGAAHIVEAGTKGMKGLETIAVSSLMGPLAIMMLAGAVAEQRKLQAIEKSLAEIKTAIVDVARFQQQERRSVLKGAIRYFQQVASPVLTGELAPEVLQEIERHEVDLVRVQEHLTEELRDRITGLRAIRKETFGSSKFAKALQETQTELDAKYDELLLCLRARACGYQLLCAFPGRQAGKAARLADITTAIETIFPMGEITTTMDAILREKIAAMSSFEAKSLILGSENLLLDRIVAARTGIFEGLESVRSDALKASEPTSIDFRMENGQPVAMRLV